MDLVIRFVIPTVFNKLIKVRLCSCLTQLYLMVEVYLHLLPEVQLHVSALDNSHLQVVHESLESIFLFISVINQLDAQNFCFTISLVHASTCFEHMC